MHLTNNLCRFVSLILGLPSTLIHFSLLVMKLKHSLLYTLNLLFALLCNLYKTTDCYYQTAI